MRSWIATTGRGLLPGNRRPTETTMPRRLLTAALRWLLYPEGHPEFCAS